MANPLKREAFKEIGVEYFAEGVSYYVTEFCQLE